MRSRTDRLRALVLALLLTAPGSPGELVAHARPPQAEIDRALDVVKADPNLSMERTIKTLRWNTPKSSGNPSRFLAWLQWLAGFFSWVSQTTRFIVWGGLIAAAAALVAYLVRAVQKRGGGGAEDQFVAPTHVMDLDIRPESLPPDIGRAARALWDGGEHRAALALLYRGLLSRLAHVHHVPIRDSSTEGDCLALSAIHLPQQPHVYVSQLVRVWQRFVYGGQPVDAPAVYVLCDDFAPALDAPAQGSAA